MQPHWGRVSLERGGGPFGACLLLRWMCVGAEDRPGAPSDRSGREGTRAGCKHSARHAVPRRSGRREIVDGNPHRFESGDRANLEGGDPRVPDGPTVAVTGRGAGEATPRGYRGHRRRDEQAERNPKHRRWHLRLPGCGHAALKEVPGRALTPPNRLFVRARFVPALRRQSRPHLPFGWRPRR